MSSSGTMHTLVTEYLAFRRRAGFQMQISGQQLLQFAAFADKSGHSGPLTRDLAIAWATFQPKNDEPSRLTAARRIEVLRSFAKFHKQFEEDTDIPPMRLFGKAHRRKVPHIYNDSEIHDLLSACAILHPSGGLRSLSCRAIIGLLRATGMRISEVTGLTRRDVDLDAGVIEVRDTKFNKSRWVPIHDTVVQELKRYAQERDSLSLPTHLSDNYFISDYNRRITTSSVQYAFGLLCKHLDLKARGEHKYVRLQDMRHTFITCKLQQWQEQGVDIDKKILSLSTYVGHTKVTDTYWYVTATPALMATAAMRFTDLCEDEKIS